MRTLDHALIAMPFYTRIRPRRPIWQPVLLGAGFLLVWTTARAVLLRPAMAAARPGVLALVLYISAFTIIGGSVAGACYWALDFAPFRRSPLMRWLGGTVTAAICLTILALAASQFGPKSPLARVFEPGFVISTVLVSAIFGAFFAKGILTRTHTAERVYLTPAEFTALSPADQARLQLDTGGTPPATDSTGTV